MSDKLKLLIALTIVLGCGCGEDLVKPLGSPCPLAKDTPPPESLGCERGSSAEAEWSMLAFMLDNDPSTLDRAEWDGLCIEVRGVVNVDPEDDHGQYSVRFSAGQDPDNQHVLRCCPHGDLGNLTIFGSVRDGDSVSFVGVAKGNSTLGYCIESCSVHKDLILNP